MVEYACGLTVFCQSSQIAQLVEVLALTNDSRTCPTIASIRTQQDSCLFVAAIRWLITAGSGIMDVSCFRSLAGDAQNRFKLIGHLSSNASIRGLSRCSRP